MSAPRACPGCERTDVEILPDSAGRLVCEKCLAPPPAPAPARETKPLPPSSSASSSPVDVPVPVPVPYLPTGERADLDVELARYGAGEVTIEVPETPPLPGFATESMERVYADLAFCSALLRAAGDDGTVIYAVDWAARRLGYSGKTVSAALRRLRKTGAIALVKVLPATRPGLAGARVYALGAERGEVRPPLALSVEADRAGAVQESEEAPEDVAVVAAVAADGREGPEDDGRGGASEDATRGEVAGVGAAVGHRSSSGGSGNVPPDRTSSRAVTPRPDDDPFSARIYEVFGEVTEEETQLSLDLDGEAGR